MADFPDVPKDIYQYKNEFSYSVWTPGSTIIACNVPWDSNYRDVVLFENDDARKEYFDDASVARFMQMRMCYLKFGEPVRVSVPFNTINTCNYLVVENSLQPTKYAYGADSDTKTTYYYFITDVKYIAPNTTQLNVQLDVFQTFADRMDFKKCFVERGHIGIANENATIANAYRYLTDLEGFELGGDYMLNWHLFHSFISAYPLYVVQSTTSLMGDMGDVNKPKLKVAEGSINYNIRSACETWVISPQSFGKLCSRAKSYPWVAQGIVSVTLVPKVFCETPWGDPTKLFGDVNAYPLKTETPSVTTIHIKPSADDPFGIPSRYKSLTKFYTYPYCCIELNNMAGRAVILKPEALTFLNNRFDFDLLAFGVTNPPTVRGYVFPSRYHYHGSNSGNFTTNFADSYTNDNTPRHTFTFYSGEALSMALVYDNFPQIPVVNNNAVLAKANSANSINYSYSAADWSYTRAQAGNRLAYSQAGQQMALAQQQRDISNNLAWTNNNIGQQRNLYGGVSGMLGSAFGGNLGGVLGSALDTAANAGFMNESTSASVNATNASTAANLANAQYMRDSNYEYAQMAAQGDYSNTIAGIQAKVQDLALTPPSMVGAFGGDSLNMSVGYTGVYVKYKRIQDNYLTQIGEYWLRYGYMVNRWITPPKNLQVMNHFTFWKCKATQINGEIPELYKETLRGIFETGVTVWKTPSEINNIDWASNTPLSGIRY